MRKQVMSITLLCLGAVSMTQANEATGKTFFSVRPYFMSSMPEKVSQWHGNDKAFGRDCGWGGALQIVGFGGQSVNGSRLARYFMYGGQDELSVINGPDALPTTAGDLFVRRGINPVNFGIGAVTATATYTSVLTFDPRHTYAGVGFDYKQYFGRCADKRWWFELSFPVYWVKNDMRIDEVGRTVTAEPTTLITNMEEAFMGNDFDAVSTSTTVLLYGKINGANKKTGVGDVEVKLGYDYYTGDCCHLDGYVGVVIPTGNKPKGEYMFEAIVGNNHHFGVMWGGSFGTQVWEGCNSNVYFEFETNGRYLFRNTQTRSFDLKYRPWSRYNLVYPAATSAFGLAGAVNGINVFTQELNVTPGYWKDFNTAIVYSSRCGFEAEIGYNFWSRQCDKVSLRNDWTETVAVADIEGAADAATRINMLSNIGNNNAGAGFPFLPANLVTADDLDLASAASPCAISNIIYGSLGWAIDCFCFPVFVGIGGSYEFSSFNTALQRWMVWGKFGVSL